MEEILSSIKRIIAEDADNPGLQGGGKGRHRSDTDRESRRRAVVASMAGEIDEVATSYVDEVLELTDEMPKVGKSSEAGQAVGGESAPARHDMQAGEEAAAISAPASRDTIVSIESEVAARSSLEALSSMIVTSSGPGDHTLEGMVREMLRPMLKEWLDANLPAMVEGMVAKEIARITGRPL